MAQDSILWTTNGTGDGASGGYTQDEITQWQQMLFQKEDNQGVLKSFLNGLAVTDTGGASPVNIATGGAMVQGYPYWNDAAGTKNIPTPTVSTRVDVIVVEADWTAQTVRFDRVAGVEGAGVPSLTQTDGTLWQIPLAEVSITTGGVITLTDAREYLQSNFEIGTGNVQDNFPKGIDGDILDIDWNPTYYTPAVTPSEVTSVDELTAHLYGVDQALNGKASTDHDATHVTSGSDEIDGDKLDIDWEPSNSTPATTPSEADSVDNLTAHLYGIDQKLGEMREEVITIRVFAHDEAVAQGNGADYFTVPEKLDGKNVTDVQFAVYTPSTTNEVEGKLYNLTDTVDILSTNAAISPSEYSSYDHGTASVVNPANDDLATGDRLRIDVVKAGTDTLGLDCIISVEV